MKFFEDIDAAQPLIEEKIGKFGYAAEHNFYWYRYYCEPEYRNIFVTTDRGALFTSFREHKQEYSVVFDPLALPENRASILVEYIEWIFSNTPARKIWFQLETPARRELLRTLPDRYRANKNYYTLVWPITDLQQFDPELPGGHYKTIRKEMHRFYREHKVEVRDAKTYEDIQNLHAIVDNWDKSRRNHECTSSGAYHNVIDGRFEGMDEARVFMVDGKAAGINAGFRVPNNDRYYGSVGVHDYSVDDLGDMFYLEDLVWLKKAGYREADMGGSEKPLLAFKKKFCPTRYYKTFTFSVVKRS